MHKIPVKQIDGNKVTEYSSLEEASVKTGISPGNIIKACKGQRKHAGGYGWEYVNKTKKPTIYQLDAEGKTINTFKSVSEAAEHTGVSRGLINLACTGKRETAAGYYWKREYTDE